MSGQKQVWLGNGSQLLSLHRNAGGSVRGVYIYIICPPSAHAKNGRKNSYSHNAMNHKDSLPTCQSAIYSHFSTETVKLPRNVKKTD